MQLMTLGCSVASAFAVVVVLAVVLLRPAVHDGGRSIEGDAPAAIMGRGRPEQNTSGNLTVIPESEWAAEMPRDRRVALQRPVALVVVSHTYSEECVTHTACVQLLRRLQRFHIAGRAYYDIGYNFMVGGDGYAYEGRGWTARAQRAPPLDASSVTLSLVGRFGAVDVPPSDLQLRTLQALVEEGVRVGAVSSDYRLLALCQVEHNQSPGRAAYERLRELPHWAGSAADNCSRWGQ